MPNYPALPGHRLRWDADGTIMFALQDGSGILKVIESSFTRQMNGESGSHWSFGTQVGGGGGAAGGYFIWIFPERRDITHYFTMNYSGYYESSVSSIDYSTDTTNGVDGTWTSSGVNYKNCPTMKPNYRQINTSSSSTADGVVPFAGAALTAMANIKAMRIHDARGGNGGIYWMHIYGNINSAVSEDRVDFWDPTLNQQLNVDAFNWNDVAQGSVSSPVSFRIKNLSASHTAQNIQLSTEALTDGPTVGLPQQFTYSTSSSGTYTQTLNIGNLAPGAISSVLYLKRNTDPNADLWLWTPWYKATPTTWV